MQVAHALYTYRHAAKHWILAAPDPDHPAFAQLAAVVKDWLLVTVTDNESVVAAYRHLKRAMAMSMPERSPQVVLLSNDFADATVVHARLRRATQEFLKNDLPLAMVAKNTHAAALRMAAITVSQPPAPPGVGVPDDTDLHAKIWTTVLDELCGTAVEEEGACKESSESSMPADLTVDQAIAQATQVVAEIAQRATDAEVASRAMYDNLSGLGNVLDDAERTALAVGLDEPEDHTYLAGGLARRSTGEDEKKQERPPLTNDHQSRDCQGATGTIRAMEVTEEETNRKTQWEVVEGSIRDLISESVLLDARPPMSWAKESCVAVDGDGGMHVWTLYKDGVSWFALREWANEHRAILALTRRDLTIEKARAVQVHLVMPLEGGGKEDAKPLLRTETPDVFVYRLRLIQWQGRRGVIVVPIA
ncbi:MAG: hypothetical protein FWD53_00695, partial [Phycisphaerales bacterium]|nr:hypothetical protein [Phycisphaerales bacterium]